MIQPIDEARRRLDEASRSGSLAAMARATCDLGVALYDDGDAQGARAAWEWVVNSGDLEQLPRALRNLAAVVRAAGELDVARELLRRAIAMNHPEWSREAALDLAAMYERGGDRTGAAATLAPIAQWVDSAPAALVQFVRGRCFELQGDTAAAVAAFEDVLTQPPNPKSSLAARHLAAIYERAGKPQSAEWASRRAIEAAVAAGDRYEEAHARASRGELLLRRQDIENARIEFGRAVQIECPRVRPLAHYRLGRILLAESDTMPAPRRRRRLAERAVAHFRQALEDDDADLAVDIRLSLGYGYELMDDLATARSMYDAAVDIAVPAQGGAVLLAFAEFLVRHKLRAEAEPILDSLIESAASDIAERARTVRDRRAR